MSENKIQWFESLRKSQEDLRSEINTVFCHPERYSQEELRELYDLACKSKGFPMAPLDQLAGMIE